MRTPLRALAVLATLSLALGAAACGRTKLADGDDDADDDPDAGPVEGVARVTVLTAGRRVPAVATVVFFDASGEATEVVETDDDGVASSTVLPGGALAAFLDAEPLPSGTIPQREVRVVLDVAPGDDILLAGNRFNSGGVVASMTLRFPDEPNGTSFGVQTPCGFFAAPREGGDGVPVATVMFYESCMVDDFTVVAVARNTEPIRSIVLRGVAVDDGATVTVTDPWVDLAEETASFEAIPSEIGQLGAGVTRVQAGDDLDVDLDLGTDVVTDDDLTIPFFDVADVDGSTLGVVVDGPADINGFGQQRWYLRASGGGSREVSSTDLMLPWPGSPAFDVAGRSVFWSQVGPGDWDATYVTMSWQAQVGGDDTFGNVLVVAPPGANVAALPPVPSDYLAWLPDGLRITQSVVQLVESSELDGWDAARQRGLDPSHLGAPESLTTDGTIRHSFSPLPFFGVR